MEKLVKCIYLFEVRPLTLSLSSAGKRDRVRGGSADWNEI
jgi:hypothetical protein